MKNTCPLAVLALALAAAALPAAPHLEKVVDGLASPVALVPYPGEPHTVVVVDQAGVAYRVEGNEKTPWLDLTGRLAELNKGFDERGLLDLAFHPKFPENGLIYVYYSAPLRESGPEEWNHTSHLSEFRVADGKPDLDSERVLLHVDQPFFNHDSGRLLFGADGFLYVSLGDGGGANGAGKFHVEMGNSQDKSQLLGKILRIDVDKRDAGEYGIPPDNPFVGKEGRGEIWALGLRNPWGLTWHPDDPGKIILGEIGQNRFEEINVVGKGDNMGWNIREGFDGFDPQKAMDKTIDKPKTARDGQALTDPVLVYNNNKFDPQNGSGISICGGYVYEGAALPELKGKYVFGDWASTFGGGGGHIYVATIGGDKWTFEPLALADSPDGRIEPNLMAFGVDAAGELYVLTNAGNAPMGDRGAVWKLVP